MQAKQVMIWISSPKEIKNIGDAFDQIAFSEPEVDMSHLWQRVGLGTIHFDETELAAAALECRKVKDNRRAELLAELAKLDAEDAA